MKSYLFLILFLSFFSITSCRQSPPDPPVTPEEHAIELESPAALKSDTQKVESEDIKELAEKPSEPSNETEELPSELENWTELVELAPDIQLDLRYATENNFVESQMYECGRCYLRPEVALAVAAAHEDLKTRGYGGLKFFDCYRPRPIQWELWKKIPNPQYVADPRKGSMHNRGAAVDLTIVDVNGNELDMGTDFDFFGKPAYHDYTDLPQEVLDNRQLLKSVMDEYGFRSVRTEWWHYSYRPVSYPLSDMMWECPPEG